jgi:hypothetical protein
MNCDHADAVISILLVKKRQARAIREIMVAEGV